MAEMCWAGLGDLFVTDDARSDEADHFDLKEQDARILLKEFRGMTTRTICDKERLKSARAAIDFLASEGIT